MENLDERHALLVRVVHGEASLTAFATVGIVPHFAGRSLTFENAHRLEAIVTIRDLASGLLTEHPEPGYTPATAYRRWAFAVMAWEFADLQLYDDDAAELLPLEDLVLDTLWDETFGNPISDRTRHTLTAITDGTPTTTSSSP